MNRHAVRWLLGLALMSVIGLAVAWRDRFDVAALQTWVESAGAAAPLVFIALYAAATVLFLPGSVITLAGGVLFGPVWGTLWSLTGATLGAALAFLIARYLGGDWIARRAGPRLSRLNDGVAAEGWRFIAFVRLVPLFPFNLLNYALGLTRIAFLPYVLASALFMLPGALAFTWLGYAGREALSGGEGTVRAILIALALVASMVFLPRWIRKLRAKPMPDVAELKRQLDAGENVLVLDVRGASEFTGEGGHISGALNLALEDLPKRMAELEDYKQSTIRLVCRTDRRSAQAAQLLTAAGFIDAQPVRGGMTAWHAKGWPSAQ
ncbi:MAG: VTT domain-containing protein [Rhodoferax sp.]|uniref:VTT domain-containing protein n=1 Tax=Rhodoferax sp. TaxID=50421 RepID=UPI0008B6780A|nr:VTT domain-containing protein [Rhodoferax sp.]MDP2678129.1 VTT domain-containing protein [Rhodoferax sp.]OGB80392.1 MAG: sulfurtransferase [Burkholderiales bacterium RIFOXYC12_FULL_60_6]